MNQSQELTMGRRWLIFSTVFLLGILCSFALYKAPPLFSMLIPSLGFTEESIGMVVSMPGIIGLILAFPAGMIMQRLGMKTSLIIAAASVVLGSVIGALATDSTMLLISRFVEGVAVGLISVVGPASIASIIPREKQGLAMGIWSIWMPVGVVLAFNTAPLIATSFGWSAVWWVGAILTAAALVFLMMVYVQPNQQKSDMPAPGAEAMLAKPDMRSVVFVAIGFMAFAAFNAAVIAGFYPTFLQETFGMDAQVAGSVASITNLCLIVVGPLMGVLSDKLHTRKWLLVFGFAGAALFLTFGFGSNIALIYAFLVGFSFFAGAIGTCTFAIVPELAKQPQKVGLGMAIVAFLQNLGIIVGSMVFPLVAAGLAWDWNAASLVFCVPLAVLGLVAVFFVKEKRASKA